MGAHSITPAHDVWNHHQSRQLLLLINSMSHLEKEQLLLVTKTLCIVLIWDTLEMRTKSFHYHCRHIEIFALFLGLIWCNSIEWKVLCITSICEYLAIVVASQVDWQCWHPPIDIFIWLFHLSAAISSHCINVWQWKWCPMFASIVPLSVHCKTILAWACMDLFCPCYLEFKVLCLVLD